MNYPLISEYIEAIKSAEDNFNELSYLRPVLGDDGEPVMSVGGFSVVFKMKDERNGKLYAVKCFTKEQAGRAESYKLIADELEFVSSNYLTPVKYLERELFVDTEQSDEDEFPVLLMNWVEGKTLDVYIKQNIDNQYALEMLAYQFSKLAGWLMTQPFAHGDLKPDNILVRKDGTLVLIDYDGMYVPTMKGQIARELGSPDYRHPSRTENDFNEHIDDFSLLSILLSLKVISLHADLLERYETKDRLLFSEKDYRNVSRCQLLKDLYPSEDAEVNLLISLFTIALVKTNLSCVSYRLFSFNRPQVNVVPQVPKSDKLSAKVTESDLANAWIDEFGVKYSTDRKRLLQAPETIEKYAIREGTKIICHSAFSLNFGLSSIYIPSSVTSIGDGAFFDCSCLKSINIPSSVTGIGVGAFVGCCSLESISIPFSVVSIGDRAFEGCCGLKSITVAVENSVFDSRNNCNAIIKTSLNEIIVGCMNTTIPNTVTKIADSAFAYCRGLTAVTIPEGVTSIGDNAFSECEGLTAISIPSSMTCIGNRAFEGCNGLTAITIPEGVTSIGDYAFSECEVLIAISIPSSMTCIGNGSFSNCSGLKTINVASGNSVFDSRNNCNAIIKTNSSELIAGCKNTTIPKSVKRICSYAFGGCSDLSFITIPEGVISIGDWAFSGCSGLTSISIPGSVTCIGNGAFSNCSGLESINVANGNSVFDSRNNCNAIIETNSNKIIAGCMNTVIPNSVTGIGSSAFSGCLGLKSINIPNSVTSIGSSAFSGCLGLKYINIPNSVTSIGDEAFKDCSSLTSISISNTVTTIDDFAFSGCVGLTSVTIPKGVTSIGNYAFYQCEGLTSVTIPNSVTSIGNGAFNYCGLTSVKIPNSVMNIDNDSFFGCLMETIYIPRGARNKFAKLLPSWVDKLVETNF